MTVRFPELGIYLLPGHSESPADLLREVREAEALGLGSAWVSERFDVKEVGACCGAAAAATKDIWIGTGVTNVDTRHPRVLASLATTLWRLSGGRFALGLGRGIAIRAGMMGLQPVKNARLADTAALLRRLWNGERVVGHDSAAGKFPYLHQGASARTSTTPGPTRARAATSRRCASPSRARRRTRSPRSSPRSSLGSSPRAGRKLDAAEASERARRALAALAEAALAREQLGVARGQR